MRRPTNDTPKRVRRLVPASLGARLVWTVVLLCVITSVFTVLINGLLITWQVAPYREETVRADASGLSAFVADETGELATMLAAFASGPPISADSTVRTQDFLAASGGGAIVVVDPSGVPIVSAGSDADVARLVATAAGRTGKVEGLLAIPSGVAFVAGQPIATSDGLGGYALAAAEFGPAQQRRFDGIAAFVRLTLHPVGSAGLFDDTTPLDPPRDVSRLAFRSDSSNITAFAEMRGIDGKAAAVAELSNSDERARRSIEAVLVSSVISALLAVAVGVALGLLLAKLIRRPVERLVDHVRTHGYLAVEGVPFSAESALDDPTLPVEFRELGAVFEDLLLHLARRQNDLKDAHAKTQYAEESLGIVVSESHEVKIVLQDGRITIANPAASVALGVPETSLIDRTLSEGLEGTTITDEAGAGLEAVTLLEQALEQGTTVQLARTGQTPRWYVFQAARHTDDLHNRILITANDVTEERRLQQIRNEIVSLISHDLRSPLAVVIGYLDLLRRPLTEEERDRAIDSAKRNAGRMVDLLEDLLSATRAEELLAPAALLPIDLAGLAEEVVSSMAPTHSERALTMDVAKAPVVRGEEKRLRQVLVNLVTNAFKYAPEPEPIVVSVACEGDSAILRVIDRGPGVPEEDRERIFERYTRLGGTSAGRPGVGLGLYIVRIIAENHGGSARVEDTPGGGATFVVELPCAGLVRDGRLVTDEPAEVARTEPEAPEGTEA
ncbi:MAG: ATP-binding protein [Coriobacteriia bacterium]|nr:ATP-binding protein [Coriobacteriia bacterium]